MPSALADAIFWVSVVICAVAQGAILRSVFGASAEAAPAAPAGVPRPRRVVEIVWAIVPAIALAVLFAFTWRAIHPVSGAAHSLELRTALRAPSGDGTP
jgi:heme/copper-type cytochrome/quinol oxidase subunit 2